MNEIHPEDFGGEVDPFRRYSGHACLYGLIIIIVATAAFFYGAYQLVSWIAG